MTSAQAVIDAARALVRALRTNGEQASVNLIAFLCERDALSVALRSHDAAGDEKYVPKVGDVVDFDDDTDDDEFVVALVDRETCHLWRIRDGQLSRSFVMHAARFVRRATLAELIGAKERMATPPATPAELHAHGLAGEASNTSTPAIATDASAATVPNGPGVSSLPPVNQGERRTDPSLQTDRAGLVPAAGSFPAPAPSKPAGERPRRIRITATSRPDLLTVGKVYDVERWCDDAPVVKMDDGESDYVGSKREPSPSRAEVEIPEEVVEALRAYRVAIEVYGAEDCGFVKIDLAEARLRLALRTALAAARGA